MKKLASFLLLSISSSVFACTPCTPWSCPPDACDHYAITKEIDLNNIETFKADNIIKDRNQKEYK